MSETLYDRVGEDFFVDLVDRFYHHVEDDPPLRALYPDDLEPGKAALADFLAQYWGGPPRYSEKKGHPRLRMRHMGFAIDADMADRWLRAMTAAVAHVAGTHGIDPDDRAALHAYFDQAAPFMVNQGLSLRG